MAECLSKFLHFSEIRPTLVATIGEKEELLAHDGEWQDLIKLAHGNNARRSYRKLYRSLKKQLSAFNVAMLSNVAERGVDGRQLSDLTPAEKLIVDTLDNSVPSAAASYRQGILDLRDGQRLSYRGTASEFREALRETLDHLAPNSEANKQPGFTLEIGRSAIGRALAIAPPVTRGRVPQCVEPSPRTGQSIDRLNQYLSSSRGSDA